MASSWRPVARVPLPVLDLSPFSSGSPPRGGARNTLDPAEGAQQLGRRRFWLAEHHPPQHRTEAE